MKNKQNIWNNWVVCGICISLIMAIVFSSFYGIFERDARENINNPLEDEENLTYLYKNCYVLYKELYNKQNQQSKDYVDLYLEPAEGYEWLLEDGTVQMAERDFLSKMNGGTISDGDYSLLSSYRGVLDYFEDNYSDLESAFTQLNNTYDYVVQDTVTGEYVTNLTQTNVNYEEQFFCLTFLFDENGSVSIGSDIKGNDVTRIRKSANDAIRTGDLNSRISDFTIIRAGYLNPSKPGNCKITYCISNLDWERLEYEGLYSAQYLDNTLIMDKYNAYQYTNCLSIYYLLFMIVFLAGLFSHRFADTKPWNNTKICRRIPAEGLLFLGYLMIVLGSGLLIYLIMWVNSGSSIDGFIAFMPRELAYCLVYGFNILVVAASMFVAWYMGICTKVLRELKLKKYIRQKSICYRIFPYTKKKFMEFYKELEHFELTQNAGKLICKIVIINGIALFIICCLPFVGFVLAAIYSLLLYYVLKKYISGLQKKYSILLKATNEIAEGNLNADITEDLGVFEPFKPQVIRIQNGFRKAVEEEVKSQRMKTELITNVSHDLKTPLTAIITYINLMKDEKLTEEKRKEYLDTLERKSLRLKVLIEDLFEVSKANSQNITLDIMDVDIINLLKQVSVEMSDKLTEKELEVRMDLPEEKIILPLDSQKTYRIFENLFGNVAKYALPGTRVYVQCSNTEEGISVVLKNITAQEIQVSAEELTERFVRGDASRNTEGSGLGLAIAKSFTELQGGVFKIDVDGDLFKVIVTFPLT